MKLIKIGLLFSFLLLTATPSFALFEFFDKSKREERKKQELDNVQQKFSWWPTDAKPGIVADERGGYWWWPKEPGEQRPWGNRGYIFVYKIIYDYKEQVIYEGEAVQAPTDESPLKPSLLVKKIIKNVKIYFDYNKAELREDHYGILDNALKALNKNPEARFLVTGNCDTRGSSEYNMKLGRKRGDVVKEYMIEHGISEDRINIISRGKLDAISPVTDLVGMQKDRNAQFMVAEVEEIMIPNPEQAKEMNAQEVEEGKFVVEEEKDVETAVQVSTKEYVIQKDDSLWKIAARELGSGHRWQYLYEFNKDRIKNPNKLKAGVTILIPIE